MGKAVMISIRPEWCRKIISGEKTVEVRKNKPTLKTPFKCYIYCTAGTGKNTLNIPISHKRIIEHYAETGSMECMNCPMGNKKVIGEFVCDRITQMSFSDNETDEIFQVLTPGTSLSVDDVRKYAGGKWLCYWHISSLVVYDQPKELSEFTGIKNTRFGGMPYRIQRPPQSWCYVEERK